MSTIITSDRFIKYAVNGIVKNGKSTVGQAYDFLLDLSIVRLIIIKNWPSTV